MTTEWSRGTARDVKVGDRIRTASGEVVTVSRIEMSFLGRSGMLALIEDSSERWYKRPLPVDAPVEIAPRD